MVDETVGFIVVNEGLRLRIKVESTVESECANADVDDGCTVVTIALVEGELTSSTYTFQEVCVAFLWVGKLVDDLLYIGNRAFEALVDFSLRSFDVWNFAFTLEAFTFEDNLATVGIGVGDVPPNADCIGMLLRSVDFDLDWELVILTENVLNGVDVVLTHVCQTATIIVKVAAEGLVGTMDIVGLEGSRAEPEVVVEFFGNGLNLEVFLTYPEEFPCETCCSGYSDLERPAEQTAVDEFLEWLDFCAETIECVFEAEPCVQTEHSSVALHSLFHAFALADCARHGFFAEDVLACIGGDDRHESVPMGWCGDVNDVDIGVVNQFAEVVIGFDVVAPLLLGGTDSRVEMLLIHVAKGNETAVLVADEV